MALRFLLNPSNMGCVKLLYQLSFSLESHTKLFPQRFRIKDKSVFQISFAVKDRNYHLFYTLVASLQKSQN